MLGEIDDMSKPTRIQTPLQRMSSQRNYIRHFMLKDISLGYHPDIMVGYNTNMLVHDINIKLAELRESFDADWKASKEYHRNKKEDNIPF